MTAIVWDQVGERRYEVGVDRGVFYLPPGPLGESAVVAPWNGLRSVEETPNRELKPYYVDGRKYLEVAIPGDYTGRITAYTYPDEFEVCSGVGYSLSGDENSSFTLHDQKQYRFHLSYRTMVGDDVNGADQHYKIHLLYNLLVIPDTLQSQTLGREITPGEFSWNITGMPYETSVSELGFRPTAHVSIDSRRMDPDLLASLESQLYGGEEFDGQVLSISEITAIVGSWYG